MKTAHQIKADNGLTDQLQAAEKSAIAADQNWALEMTRFIFDDNSFLAVTPNASFAVDSDDIASIDAYRQWPELLRDDGDIDPQEQAEIDRLVAELQ